MLLTLNNSRVKTVATQRMANSFCVSETFQLVWPCFFPALSSFLLPKGPWHCPTSLSLRRTTSIQKSRQPFQILFSKECKYQVFLLPFLSDNVTFTNPVPSALMAGLALRVGEDKKLLRTFWSAVQFSSKVLRMKQQCSSLLFWNVC